MNNQPQKVLTIGGSDSGGAAGIQADLKTWSALGVYGMSVITAVTAQNSVSVEAVQFLSRELVGTQINTVLSDYGAEACKTGFLGKAEIIEEVAARLQAQEAGPLVVDPVLVNHKGQSMFPQEVVVAYGRHLLELAEIATPNWREAALLAGFEAHQPPDRNELLRITERLQASGTAQLLITGVPAEDRIIDYWFDGENLLEFPLPRIKSTNRHGSGDTLSAAICAYLALGEGMAGAIQKAQAFTARALTASSSWQLGHGHGPLSHFIDPNQGA